MLDRNNQLLDELNFIYDLETEELKCSTMSGKDIWVEGFLARMLHTEKFEDVIEKDKMVEVYMKGFCKTKTIVELIKK